MLASRGLAFPRSRRLTIDFSFQRSVKRTTIAHLSQLELSRRSQERRVPGPPGTGKTHLSIALGVQACRRAQRVAFATAHEWVNRLGAGQHAGRLDDELERLGRVPLLIVDEVGYIPFDPEAAALFFALISSRYKRSSLILSSNKTFSAWGGDLRRSGCCRCDGRPFGAPRRGHRAEGGQLSPKGQGKGGLGLRIIPLRVLSFQPADSVQISTDVDTSSTRKALSHGH